MSISYSYEEERKQPDIYMLVQYDKIEQKHY